MTIEHADSEIGILEEDNLTVIGLAGTASGERAEVSLQFDKKTDWQDRQLGHDRLYIDYNQLGGYGVVTRITLAGNSAIKITLNIKARDLGIPDVDLVFNFAGGIDRHAMEMLKSVCLSSDTEFKIRQSSA